MQELALDPTLIDREAMNSAKNLLFIFLFIMYNTNQSPMLNKTLLRYRIDIGFEIIKFFLLPAFQNVVLNVFLLLVVVEVLIHFKLYQKHPVNMMICYKKYNLQMTTCRIGFIIYSTSF